MCHEILITFACAHTLTTISYCASSLRERILSEETGNHYWLRTACTGSALTRTCMSASEADVAAGTWRCPQGCAPPRKWMCCSCPANTAPFLNRVAKCTGCQHERCNNCSTFRRCKCGSCKCRKDIKTPHRMCDSCFRGLCTEPSSGAEMAVRERLDEQNL